MKNYIKLSLHNERNGLFPITYTGSQYGRGAGILITIAAVLFTVSMMTKPSLKWYSYWYGF